MKAAIWTIIICFGILAVFLVLDGMANADIGEIIPGMVCGLVSFFFIFVEGASNGT